MSPFFLIPVCEHGFGADAPDVGGKPRQNARPRRDKLERMGSLQIGSTGRAQRMTSHAPTTV